jgi:hypothetical protein
LWKEFAIASSANRIFEQAVPAGPLVWLARCSGKFPMLFREFFSPWIHGALFLATDRKIFGRPFPVARGIESFLTCVFWQAP